MAKKGFIIAIVFLQTFHYINCQDTLRFSGQLLKRITLTDVKKNEGRWFPTKMVYQDVLKQGNGTEFFITSAKFNQTIPDYIFSKASLKQ